MRGIDIDIAEREFVVIVGPSGCGKSTLLRMIAGLETIIRGDLVIDGQRMNDVRPADRGIAMVFQSYALYPHKTVEQNMGFALKVAKTPKDEAARKIARAAEILQLGPLLKRLPKELSGGQRQRVAIGRAIVRNPKVFLFDEPLSNLDASLRLQMRIELAQLHRELQATMVYVTHDQIEAMTLADKIVVLRDGLVEQIGAPLDIYRRPANTFVAGFIGSPKMKPSESPCRGDRDRSGPRRCRRAGLRRGRGSFARLSAPRSRLASGPSILRPDRSAGAGAGQRTAWRGDLCLCPPCRWPARNRAA